MDKLGENAKGMLRAVKTSADPALIEHKVEPIVPDQSDLDNFINRKNQVQQAKQEQIENILPPKTEISVLDFVEQQVKTLRQPTPLITAASSKQTFNKPSRKITASFSKPKNNDQVQQNNGTNSQQEEIDNEKQSEEESLNHILRSMKNEIHELRKQVMEQRQELNEFRRAANFFFASHRSASNIS